MPLNILVVGAGVCGPAFASLIQRSNPNHKITIIERGSSLRLAGQQIDVKAQGIPILKKMGIMESIKSHCVNETGLEVVNADGKNIAQFGVNPSDKRGLALTSEYEIMRGDMVKVIYEDSLAQNAKIERDTGKRGGLTYKFGKTIKELHQLSDGADVTFSDGATSRYDLVVAADGQGSRTRRQAFGAEVSDSAFKSLGVHSAYFSIPRIEGEGGMAKAHFAQNTFLLTRTSNRPVTGMYIFTMKDSDHLRASYKEPAENQKEVWGEVLKGTGWQTERFTNGLQSCDDFYAHEQGQVKAKELYKGRVVLLGDAGYCPSPFTGLGTTASLVGSYILAGELARHGEDVDAALKSYEKNVRPPIDEIQRLPMGNMSVIFPSSKLGVWVLTSVFRAVSAFRIDKMVSKLFPENSKGAWVPPEYPELGLAE